MLEHNSHHAKNPYFLPAVLIGAIVLVALVVFMATGSLKGLIPGQGSLSKTLSEGNKPLPTSPDGQLHYLSGQVTSVEGGVITIEALLPGASKPATVKVEATGATVLSLRTLKSPEIMGQEMRAYQQKVAAFSAASTTNAPGDRYPVPPLPYTSREATLADIKTGMMLSVVPVDGTKEDATSVVAAKIDAQALVPVESPSPVPTPANTPAGQ
jgi:hypothetical protein